MRRFIYIIVLIFCLFSVAYAALRDPTKLDALPWETIDDGQDFIVSAILISEGRKVAIIDREPFEEGDTVNDVKIISIQPNEVKFRGKDEEFSRELHRPVLEPINKKEKER